MLQTWCRSWGAELQWRTQPPTGALLRRLSSAAGWPDGLPALPLRQDPLGACEGGAQPSKRLLAASASSPRRCCSAAGSEVPTADGA